MIRKDYLIRHCEKMIDRYKFRNDNIYLEHKIFLELLTGKNVNEMFDKNGEYVNNEAVFANKNWEEWL